MRRLKSNEKTQNPPSRPIYDDIYNSPNKRPNSRNPIRTLINSTNTEENLWNTHGKDGTERNNHFIRDPTQLV